MLIIMITAIIIAYADNYYTIVKAVSNKEKKYSENSKWSVKICDNVLWHWIGDKRIRLSFKRQELTAFHYSRWWLMVLEKKTSRSLRFTPTLFAFCETRKKITTFTLILEISETTWNESREVWQNLKLSFTYIIFMNILLL